MEEHVSRNPGWRELMDRAAAHFEAERFARGVASDTTKLPRLREEAERHLAMLERELAAHRERYGQRVPDAPGNAPRARAVAWPAEGPRLVH
jgi:hypothetical protein